MNNILVLEDHLPTLDWIEALLRKHYSDAYVYKARNIAEAESVIKESGNLLNMAILDANLPDGNGLNLLTTLKKKNEKIHCLIFTICDDEERILQAFLLGTDGFILKSASETDIIECLNGLLRGIPAISPAVTRKLIKLIQNNLGSKHTEVTASLSEREREVLLFIAKGYNKREIGISLGLTENTIKDYSKRIYTKLGINSVAEATYIALNSGMLRTHC
jgi:DNA-binding NarL/FixJ family response regulator